MEPVMTEVKKLKTLQKVGEKLEQTKLIEKTRKYLVRNDRQTRVDRAD
jgi:hypothetical protein